MKNIILICLISSISLNSAHDLQMYPNLEYLDTGGKYRLEWKVDWLIRKISFEVTVQTRSAILFGLNRNSSLNGGDVIVGGVEENGSVYFAEFHGISNKKFKLTKSQDWSWQRAHANATHTVLSFSRNFTTCDENDYQINEHDTTTLHWGFGQTHVDSRDGWYFTSEDGNYGVYEVNLLVPSVISMPLKEWSFREGLPPDSDNAMKNNLKIWTVTTEQVLSARETLYQCTLHKAPPLERKHHVIGFHTRLETIEARRHTHHLDLHRCKVPSGFVKRIFDRFVNTRGQNCRFLDETVRQHCTEIVNGWSIGGRITFFPEHTGQPFGETGGTEGEYYLLQVHYNNPNLLPNLRFPVNFDLYYTDQLRPNEVGLMTVGITTPGSPSFIIPPKTPSQVMQGHCSPACTREFLPNEGITVFMTLLHTHSTGRKLRLRHIRGETELPWISNDDTYNPQFQNYRLLRREVQVLPGDQLVMQCEFDTTLANGTVMGGYATRSEMCIGFLHFYASNITELDGFSSCASQLQDIYYMKYYLGVENATWSEDETDYVVTSPSRLRGMTMKAVSDMMEWTPKLKKELQEDYHNILQGSSCQAYGPIRNNEELVVRENIRGEVSIPGAIREYTPAQTIIPDCSEGFKKNSLI